MSFVCVYISPDRFSELRTGINLYITRHVLNYMSILKRDDVYIYIYSFSGNNNLVFLVPPDYRLDPDDVKDSEWRKTR